MPSGDVPDPRHNTVRCGRGEAWPRRGRAAAHEGRPAKVAPPARSLGGVGGRWGSRGGRIRLWGMRHGHVLDVGRRAAGRAHGGARRRPTLWVGVRASRWRYQVVLGGVGQLEAPQESDLIAKGAEARYFAMSRHFFTRSPGLQHQLFLLRFLP